MPGRTGTGQRTVKVCDELFIMLYRRLFTTLFSLYPYFWKAGYNVITKSFPSVRPSVHLSLQSVLLLTRTLVSFFDGCSYLAQCLSMVCITDHLYVFGVKVPYTVEPVLSGHTKRIPKLVFKTYYRLMQVKSFAECSKGSILQNFWPSLSYHLSLISLFCLFLSGRLRQVLLYLNSVLRLCFVCFFALRPKSTAMVMAGRSVHLT